ncbi:MAG: aminopeptidase P N-terminal domain-containing protein [Armatimonadetes bacterium]|nr:aminopeptidase P N-terminal domain-containing protein [Armatimonadota bacterium]
MPSLFQTHFTPAELTDRRRRVLAAVGDDAVALVQGAAPPRGFVAFRQTNELYYLTGLEVPQAYLLLDGRAQRSTIYLPPRRETPGAEGDTLGAQDEELIRAHTGVDRVRPLAELANDLAGATTVYTPHQPAEGFQSSRDEMLHAERLIAADPWDAAPTREQRLIDLLCDRLPGVTIADLSPITDRMRGIKSAAEIAVMRRAGELSAQAIIAAMAATRPGLYEYQLNALANQVYLDGGARGEGYRSITAAGAGNIWFAHYWRCDCELRDGDLILMDTAPDYGYYTSDIGRMWPVNGTYSAQARELYGFVVEYHLAVLAAIRPGLTADEVHAEAAGAMAPVIDRWPWSKPAYEAAGRRMLDFRGHLSHSVGMIVHDVDNYTLRPLEPGVVFAVDPQLWVPEEKLYIRCEDTVVVTEQGCENFTAAAPLGLDEVEAFLRG